MVALTEGNAVGDRLIEIARYGVSGSEENLRKAARLVGIMIPEDFGKREIAIALYGFLSVYRVLAERGILSESEEVSIASATIMAI